MGKYDSERFTPKVPACKRANISLSFNGKNLTLIKSGKKTKSFSYSAASGKPINGIFDYSKERQKAHFKGPIPEGEYWINPEELWENAWYKRGSTESWGDYRITIHPYPTTLTHGRGGFFIHGGKVLGSAGCIDLTKNINTLVKQIDLLIDSKGKCFIPLTVKY